MLRDCDARAVVCTAAQRDVATAAVAAARESRGAASSSGRHDAAWRPFFGACAVTAAEDLLAGHLTFKSQTSNLEFTARSQHSKFEFPSCSAPLTMTTATPTTTISTLPTDGRARGALRGGGSSPVTPVEPPAVRWPRPSDAIYVIYTSGSTGEPEGVVRRLRAYRARRLLVVATGANPYATRHR